MKILIADDLKANRIYLNSLLVHNGFEVISATNGKEALELLEQNEVDMIISDILMPVLDGFKLCKEVKAIEKLRNIPFIFYTATYTEKKDEEFAKKLGADKYLIKPMESEELIAEVKDLFKKEKKQLPPNQINEEEEEFLQLYNEKLIRKLEQKMLELEKQNKEKNLLINKLRASERELIAAKNEAEKSDKLKTEFIAQMSHEIRTPINNILLFSYLLKEEYSGEIPEELEYSFKILDRASKRVIRTIELLIEISQAQTGTLEISPETIDLYEVLMEDLYLKFKKFAKEKEITFEVIRQTNNTMLKVDKYTIKEMISHLLDNALKFTNEGKIEVIIAEQRGRLAVEVVDTGIGISAAYQEKLFQAFSQEDEGVTRRYEGCGLGLALVKKYAEMNNATISVQSKKGYGSRFTVCFKR